MNTRILLLAVSMLMAACATPPAPDGIVVYRTYQGMTPFGDRVLRDIDPLFFNTKADALAYIAGANVPNPVDPGGKLLFDVEPITFETVE